MWKFLGIDYSYVEYRKAKSKYCRENNCPFYYGEIDDCMFGEDGVNKKVGIENKKCTIDMFG